MKSNKLLYIALLFSASTNLLSQPWANATIEKRAKTLLSQMTLDEKLAYVGGDKKFYRAN